MAPRGRLVVALERLMGTTPNPEIGKFDVITSMSGAAVWEVTIS